MLRVQHLGLLPFSPLHRHDLPGAACLVSSADRCSVCSVRACVLVRGLSWAVCLASGTACAAACRVQPVRVRWGWGSPPEGYTRSAGGGVGHARDKIFQRKRRFSGVVSQTTHPILTKRNVCHCASLQKFQKIQKDPFRSLYCGIIS